MALTGWVGQVQNTSFLAGVPGLASLVVILPFLCGVCFLFVGLAGGRLFGIALATDPGAYNYTAVVYEIASASVALALVRARAKAA